MSTKVSKGMATLHKRSFRSARQVAGTASLPHSPIPFESAESVVICSFVCLSCSDWRRRSERDRTRAQWRGRWIWGGRRVCSWWRTHHYMPRSAAWWASDGEKNKQKSRKVRIRLIIALYDWSQTASRDCISVPTSGNCSPPECAWTFFALSLPSAFLALGFMELANRRRIVQNNSLSHGRKEQMKRLTSGARGEEAALPFRLPWGSMTPREHLLELLRGHFLESLQKSSQRL